MNAVPSRNDPCPCGSGKKYKHCCIGRLTTRSVAGEDANQYVQSAFQHHRAGRLEQAEAIYRRALQLAPNHPDALYQLGVLNHQLGKNEAAIELIKRAIRSNRANPFFYDYLGSLYKELNRLSEAEASYRRALEINPDFAEAHYNLGVTLQDRGLPSEAERSYRRALELRPDFAEAHHNLGTVRKDQGRLSEAEASYVRALGFKPDYAEAHFNLGNVCRDQGRLIEAEASFRRALEINSDYAEAHINLGTARKDQGRLIEAEASYRRALEIDPDYAEAHNNLGIALKDQGRPSEAEACYLRALEIRPDYAEAHNNLGGTLQDRGRPSEAEACYIRALEIKPDYAEAQSNLLFYLSYSEAIDAATLFSEHCRFGEKFEAPLRASWPRHANLRDPERRLQVGFVSADLHNHAVANFIEPVLAHLSSHPQLALHAYYNHVAQDAVTQRLRGYFAQWHPIVGLSDDALAQTIRADSIDILIDLSGHTARNRLLAFARKPAPVQASWMGYPGTTGLQGMDYYLTDRLFLPHAQFASQFTEQLVYLPASAPFMPSEVAPSVNVLPALGNGYLTFGSFNRSSKISRSVIALWAPLLRALPNSHMLMGGMPEEDKYDLLIEWFAQEGIARDRLSFHARSSMERYLSLHYQVDICLDTFPYNGGTTTLHALWMGVPTLCLAGSAAAGRTGASILGHVGLEAFVAHDADDFVQKGLSWAGNLTALSDIRAGLRERIAKSAIGRPALVAGGLERALRIMWQRWCAGLPAASFEVTPQGIGNATHEADT